jgi:hypothetical protein
MNLSSNPPSNRLFCSHCCRFRYISEYPFRDSGLRRISCIYCKFRRKQKSQEKQSQEKQSQEKQSQEKQSQKKQSQEKQSQEKQSQQNSSQQNSLQQNFLHYCSSCNQPHQLSQFGQFKTCETCRAVNKKALRQRRQKILLENQPSQIRLAEAHLQAWVQHAGEEEKHTAWRKSRGFDPLEVFKRQPLTIDDYFQESEPEKLKKEWLERQQKWRQEKEQQEQEWKQRQRQNVYRTE